MRFVNTLQEIIARQMRGEGQEDQNQTPPGQRGIFGRRATLPQPMNGMLSRMGGGYEPGNPYGASLGDFPDAHGYSPPTTRDDLELAGARSSPFSEALQAAPPQMPMGNGMGGPPPNRRGLEPPSAPQRSQAEMDNQAFAEARLRAQEGIRNEGYPYWNSPATRDAMGNRVDAIEQERRARAEQQRREGVTFDQWWRLRGRQDENAPPPRPFDLNSAYRFHSPPKRAHRG